MYTLKGGERKSPFTLWGAASFVVAYAAAYYVCKDGKCYGSDGRARALAISVAWPGIVMAASAYKYLESDKESQKFNTLSKSELAAASYGMQNAGLAILGTFWIGLVAGNIVVSYDENMRPLFAGFTALAVPLLL